MIPSALVLLLLVYPPVVAFAAALYLLFPGFSGVTLIIVGVSILIFPLSVLGITSLLSRHIALPSEPPAMGIAAVLFSICFALDPVRGIDLFSRGVAILDGSGTALNVAFIGVLLGQCAAASAAVYITLALAQLSVELPCRWFFAAGGMENLVPWEPVRMITIVFLLSITAIWIFERFLITIASIPAGV